LVCRTRGKEKDKDEEIRELRKQLQEKQAQELPK